MSPRLDVKPIARRVCDAVRQGPRCDDKLVEKGILVWSGDAEVLIYHARLVGGANQQTITARRRRFRDALTTQMKEFGWNLVKVRQGMLFRKSLPPNA
jgi:hypothetical protein